ncbi:HvfC/BufC N-terminal domain-containing protein [Actinomadura harenae]|uniref:DUF2063 domain-containing protein n=1 Tax=Actinomadura harenae TaxID=2483351 RepID=A0A3M2LMF8_9ACTN|nr:DNA-binding domain-containing protein [Actinomadura harenae]RMI38306.1 DUF2063 domain-containing protein [Actinomadura harenae]
MDDTPHAPTRKDGPVLADVQHRFQYAVLASGALSDQATAMLAGTAELSAAQRLGIYRNGCRTRLLETMEHLHPALRSLLGDDLFRDFASGYLDAHPSRSSTLARLDEGFVDYLTAERPDPGGSEAWVDILIDLARYERVFAEVYDGPGTERDAPSTGPQALDGGRVVMAPCVRSLRVGAAVHEYHAAVRGGTTPPPLTPRPTRLVLWRRDYRVRVTALAPQAHDLLEALLAGATFDEARAASSLEPAAAWAHLRAWTASGWIRASAEPAPPNASSAPNAPSAPFTPQESMQ